MFFDEDFEPSNYVDALFNSVITSNSSTQTIHSSSLATSSQIYSEKNLHSLQNKCSTLISHLDYYTNELSSQLSEKLDVLKDTSSIVSANSDDSITRLQYYIISMNNAVTSLQQEVEMASSKRSTHIEPTTPGDNADSSSDSPVDNLTNLRDVKGKLLDVLDIFERIAAITQAGQESTAAGSSKNYSTVSIDLFTNSMSTLHQTIQQGFSDQDFKSINSDLVENVNSLSSMLPLFQGTPFHSIYKLYISKILADKDRYLSMRKL